MSAARPAAVAIGVFDGVHRAHRRIISCAVRTARSHGWRSVVLTFWPHPSGQASLFSLKHRLRMIAELGADEVIVCRFTARFARQSPEAFARDLLAGKLRARQVCVGENFRFGRRAGGTVGMLRQLGRRYGFSVRAYGLMRYRGRAISSTAIRSLITAGRLGDASRLLGRPVSVFGTVVPGRKIGRTLGFPTANIDPHHEVLPPAGVYAVRVLVGKKRCAGMCYIGTRPTFGKSARLSVEVHLFGVSACLYDRDIEIFFVRRIRPDRRFPSAAGLASRIRRDALAAKHILSLR